MTDELASITNDGAILMGRLLCVDGHAYGRKFFAFTHMHTDHSTKLAKCLYNGQVYMTKPTRDLLEAINDDNYGSNTNHIKKTQIITMDYNDSRLIADGERGISEKITFRESSHVLGSAQVEIISKDKKILYSGDISPGDEPPKDVHTLVVDSTHGHPQYARHGDPDSLERRFIDLMKEVICGDARPVVIHAHRGKLQEIMSLIAPIKELNNDDISIMTSATNIRIAMAYKKYNFDMPSKILDEKSDDAEGIMEKNHLPFIQFTTSFYKQEHEINGKAYSIFLADYPTDQFKENEDRSVFETTSHADYDALINYVEKSNAEKVIVDNYRTRQAKKLVEELKKKQIDAIAQP